MLLVHGSVMTWEEGGDAVSDCSKNKGRNELISLAYSCSTQYLTDQPISLQQSGSYGPSFTAKGMRLKVMSKRLSHVIM